MKEIKKTDIVGIIIIIILIVVFGIYLFVQTGNDGGTISVAPQIAGGGCGV